MAQEGYDKLMSLTDSRYRLTMIVARRAAQIKAGIPPLLEPDEMPSARQNTVSIAMRELLLDKPIRWGDDLPSGAELRRVHEQLQRRESEEFTLSREGLTRDGPARDGVTRDGVTRDGVTRDGA